jgi:hypothetical protein
MTSKKHLPFVVRVEAAFDEAGVWLIDARLQFRGGTPKIGSKLLGEGRVALLHEIARKGLRGRALGAEKVRVHLDIDGMERNLELGGGIPGPDLLM